MKSSLSLTSPLPGRSVHYVPGEDPGCAGLPPGRPVRHRPLQPPAPRHPGGHLLPVLHPGQHAPGQCSITTTTAVSFSCTWSVDKVLIGWLASRLCGFPCFMSHLIVHVTISQRLLYPWWILLYSKHFTYICFVYHLFLSESTEMIDG